MIEYIPDLINLGSQYLSGFTPKVQAITATDFNFGKMYQNLLDTFVQLKRLLFAVSYVVGTFLVMRGIMMYRIFANQTFGSAQRGEMAGPMVHILVGAVLIYFPSAIDTSLVTVFGSDNILTTESLFAYKAVSGVDRWNKIATLVVYYLHLIGIIAFFRGWIILSKMAHSGSQPGSVGKGLTHIIGGILLINIVQAVNVIAVTLGYGA